MELKEQLIAIATKELISSGASKESATAVAKWNVNNMSDSLLSLFQSYGNNCYNQALDDAAENAKVKTKVIANDFGTVEIDVWPFVDKQSILKLKKH